jgi:hypothetical protein
MDAIPPETSATASAARVFLRLAFASQAITLFLPNEKYF